MEILHIMFDHLFKYMLVLIRFLKVFINWLLFSLGPVLTSALKTLSPAGEVA